MSTVAGAKKADQGRFPQFKLEDDALKKRLLSGINSARDHLLSLQNSDGYWVGELEADASVRAGYIPLMYFLKGEVPSGRADRIIASVLHNQNADGSWSLYTGGPGDLNVSIQAYFALKLCGISAFMSSMVKACGFIIRQGGIESANLITKLWLALFGQFDWRGIPVIPPELLLLPARGRFSIYDLASWSRATVVALSVVISHRPVCRIPPDLGVSELYSRGFRNTKSLRWYSGAPLSYRVVAATFDELIRLWERLPAKPFRSVALSKAKKWITEHQESDGSWAGIMLPHIYSLVALKCLGCSTTNTFMARGIEQLDTFLVDNKDETRLQPATSPVWDTAWSVIALRESGLGASDPHLQNAARWLLEREITVAGDWKIKNPSIKPGCWSFEFVNNWYPDIDDTAEVVRALSRVKFSGLEEERSRCNAINRGIDWICGMQSHDGGWAAFDRNNNHRVLELIPFADFMAPLDPTCSDVTGHVVELLGECCRKGDVLTRALDFLHKTQESRGAWYGRWGVNFIYGTSMVLSSLQTIDDPSVAQMRARANKWITEHQLPDGSWGESCATYWDPYHSQAQFMEGTASQTSWALMGLSGSDGEVLDSVNRGLNYLLDTQKSDGSWDENAFTGVGFPRAFYLRYDFYRIYFPLLALSKWGYRLHVVNGRPSLIHPYPILFENSQNVVIPS